LQGGFLSRGEGKEMKIAVVSRSAGFHAKNIIANVLPDAEYIDWHKQELLKNYDVIYCLGWYLASMQAKHEYMNLLNMGKTLIIHWAGSDVSLCKQFEKEYGSDRIKVCTLPSRLDISPVPLDAMMNGEIDTKVSLYIPPGRADFFKMPLIMKVAEKLPEIGFIVCSFSSPRRSQIIRDNVVDWGKLGDKGIQYIMESCNIHLRLVEHDGFSLSVIENCLMGRRVITNMDYPHTHKVSLGVDEIVAKIKELAELKEPDLEAARFYEKNYGKQRYVDYIKELLNETG
jgi:hypothetical protein